MSTELQIVDDSYSVIGAKKLTFSESPDKFLHFSDTGGLLGSPVTQVLSFSDFCRQSMVVVSPRDPKQECLGRIGFGTGKYVLFTCKNSTFLRLILEWWNPSNIPVISFPGRANATQVESFKTAAAETLSTQAEFWLDNNLFSKSFLPVRLEVVNQRVHVSVLTFPPADLPLTSLALVLDGVSLHCYNKFLIENTLLDGFDVEFLTRTQAETYISKVGLSEIVSEPTVGPLGERTSIGLIGQVSAEGFIAGDKIEKKTYDAQIGDNTLTLYEGSKNAAICSFNLESPNLAIDGTVMEFVISPDASTALRITSEGKDFLQAVYQSKAVQRAAARTSIFGPFIASNDKGFVRIEKIQGTITVSVNGSEPAEMKYEIPEPKLSQSTPKPKVIVGDYEFCAELPSLEGISSVLHELFIKMSVSGDFQGAVGKMIGLEGRYLTYCVFGKLAQAHLMLTKALNVDPDASLPLLAGNREKEVFLAIMAQFAGAMSRDCETILYYFPGFVVERDKDVLATVGLLNSLDYGRAENCYQNALRTYGALTSHLYRIENVMSRFGSIQKASTKSDDWRKWVPLGASGLGCLVNPIFAIGAVQQGVSLVNQKIAKESALEQTFYETFDSCSQEWDYLIQTLIPFVSSRFAQDIYPIRLATASVLLKAYENGDVVLKESLAGLVAQRLGRLIAFCEFPSAPLCEITRLNCIEFLMERQKRARGIEQRPF